MTKFYLNFQDTLKFLIIIEQIHLVNFKALRKEIQGTHVELNIIKTSSFLMM